MKTPFCGVVVSPTGCECDAAGAGVGPRVFVL